MLSDRRQRVLQALVQEYIANAQPVGSKTLVNRYGLHVSPATVRNELSILEEEGYVVSPHTSAGRIPTDAGYRAFVNKLLEEECENPQDGSFEGLDIDVAAAIADKLGLELQVDDMDFDAALLAAQNGKSDMVMAGVTVTDERQKVMDFSDTYAEGIQSVIVPEDSDIASVDDLAGKTIGTQRGTTGYIYCTDDFGEDSVVAYDNGLTAVQALNNGQVDAVVIDNAPAKEFVAANTGLKILDTAYAQEDYAIGVAKGNTALLDAINGALKELQADGTLQSIVDKYIKAE